MKALIMSLVALPPGALGVWVLRAYIAHKRVEHMREKRAYKKENR